MRKWRGDPLFLIQNLVLKDFRIRYRNMSLGILWSLLNPLVMMAVLTFIFGRVFGNPKSATFPLFVLCGLVPFNFFSGALQSGTTSVIEGAGLIKRVSVPSTVVPIASVLSNCVHLLIQLALVLALTLLYHLPPAPSWLWLPVLWSLFIVFVCGLALGASAINVFIRDTRYVVESFNLVLFWLVPIFYSFTIIPPKYVVLYRFNPVAALVLAMRDILIDRHPPAGSIVVNMAIAAAVSAILGGAIFARLKPRFYDYI
ncbi:MAG TPA: ABC transporter permease [Bryobacteraceae bacterium]